MRCQVPPSLAGFIDAHLPQPGFTPANWAETRPLIEMVLRLPGPGGGRAGGQETAGEMMAWVDGYHRAFVQAHVG